MALGQLQTPKGPGGFGGPPTQAAPTPAAVAGVEATAQRPVGAQLQRPLGGPTTALPVRAPGAIAPQAPAAPVTTVGGAPAPAPLPNLATDPTYLEYTRSLGLSQADAQAAAQQAEAQVGANLSNNLYRDQTNTTLGINRQAGALESRGVNNSGEGLRDVNNLRIADAFRQEALRQTAAQQLSQLAENLALQHQQGDVGLANQGMTAAPLVFGNANPVSPLSTVGPTTVGP